MQEDDEPPPGDSSGQQPWWVSFTAVGVMEEGWPYRSYHGVLCPALIEMKRNETSSIVTYMGNHTK